MLSIWPMRNLDFLLNSFELTSESLSWKSVADIWSWGSTFPEEASHAGASCVYAVDNLYDDWHESFHKNIEENVIYLRDKIEDCLEWLISDVNVWDISKRIDQLLASKDVVPSRKEIINLSDMNYLEDNSLDFINMSNMLLWAWDIKLFLQWVIKKLNTNGRILISEYQDNHKLIFLDDLNSDKIIKHGTINNLKYYTIFKDLVLD